MGGALDIALADIGLWGAGLICAGTVVLLRVADRARLVNPVKQAAAPKDEPASKPDENERLSVLGGPSKGEVAA